MKKVLVLLFAWLPLFAAAQTTDSLSLVQCQQMAREQYPIIRQKDLLDDAASLKMRNLDKNWFPQIYLNGQASYQSDVTQVSIPIPGLQMPEMNKDMYKVTLDLNQVIYDGGLTSRQKQMEVAGLKADQQNVEVEVNKITERVNQCYFNVLLAQENELLLLNVREEIQNKLKKTEAAVKNEAALQNSANILKAEILKTEQQIIEVRAAKKAAIEMLSTWINLRLPEDIRLQVPSEKPPVTIENQRPELSWFDLQIDRLEAGKKVSTSKLLPRVSFFGQAGYGRPGLNMLDPDFNDWYIAGVKVSWNIWNWNLSHNEKKIIDIQKDITLSQKEAFDKNTRVALSRDLVEIYKYDELITKDKEIVALREQIATNYSIQYDNGIITATEYTTELNAAMQAKLNLQLHKLQQQLAIENYQYNSGTTHQ
jgi:outer membrane protein TolC